MSYQNGCEKQLLFLGGGGGNGIGGDEAEWSGVTDPSHHHQVARDVRGRHTAVFPQPHTTSK